MLSWLAEWHPRHAAGLDVQQGATGSSHPTMPSGVASCPANPRKLPPPNVRNGSLRAIAMRAAVEGAQFIPAAFRNRLARVPWLSRAVTAALTGGPPRIIRIRRGPLLGALLELD